MPMRGIGGGENLMEGFSAGARQSSTSSTASTPSSYSSNHAELGPTSAEVTSMPNEATGTSATTTVGSAGVGAIATPGVSVNQVTSHINPGPPKSAGATATGGDNLMEGFGPAFSYNSAPSTASTANSHSPKHDEVGTGTSTPADVRAASSGSGHTSLKASTAGENVMEGFGPAFTFNSAPSSTASSKSAGENLMEGFGPAFSYNSAPSTAATSAAEQRTPLSSGQKLLSFLVGAGEAVVDMAKGAASLMKALQFDLPAHAAEQGMTAGYRLATMPFNDAVALNFQDGLADLGKAAETAKNIAVGTVQGVIQDVKVVFERPFVDIPNDPTVTRDDMKKLGKATTNTILNIATVVEGGTGIARAATATKITYTAEVAVRVTSKGAVVEGAQSGKVLVQGSNAAEVAKALASPEARPLIDNLGKSGQQLAKAPSIAERGAIGEKVGADVSKALGADVPMPSKMGRNGIDNLARNEPGTLVIGNESKGSSAVGNEITVAKNSKTPAPGAVQGTPTYNEAQVNRMALSGKPDLVVAAQEVRSAPTVIDTVTQINTNGQLRVVDGASLEAALNPVPTSTATSNVVSGTIRQTLTTSEKTAISGASASGAGTVGAAVNTSSQSTIQPPAVHVARPPVHPVGNSVWSRRGSAATPQ